MTAVQSPLRRLENLWSSVTAFRHVFTDAKQAHAACCDCIWLVLDGILLRVFQRVVIKHSFNPYQNILFYDSFSDLHVLCTTLGLEKTCLSFDSPRHISSIVKVGEARSSLQFVSCIFCTLPAPHFCHTWHKYANRYKWDCRLRWR